MRMVTFPSGWALYGVRLIRILSEPPFCEQVSLPFIAVHSDNLVQRIGATV